MAANLWITGVAGFTGHHLVRFLKTDPKTPRIVGLDAAAAPCGLDACHRLDLTDPEAVADTARIDPPAWVIHLAGLMPPADTAAMWQANVGGTAGLLSGLRDASPEVTGIVVVGSAAEYLPSTADFLTEASPCGGVTPYGRTKSAQTMLALALGRGLGLPVMVARPFNLVGPGLPRKFVAAELCAQFADGQAASIRVGNLESVRDFVDVRDAVAAYWAIATRGSPQETYNVCSGAPTRIRDLVSLLAQVTGDTRPIETDPQRLRTADVDRACGDCGRLRAATGWTPRIPLRQSLSDMLADYRVA